MNSKLKWIRSIGLPLGSSVVGIIIIVFSFYVLRISVGYFDFEQIGFLRGKSQEVLCSIVFRISLIIHALTAPLCLVFGTVQIQSFIRRRARRIHRISGKIYTTLVLGFAAPSGLFLALYSESIISFSLLAVLWWLSTYFSYKQIRLGNLVVHRRWAIRSISLLLSAIFLRFYLVGLVRVVDDLSTFYPMISWLSWIPNLLLVEVYFFVSKD